MHRAWNFGSPIIILKPCFRWGILSSPAYLCQGLINEDIRRRTIEEKPNNHNKMTLFLFYARPVWCLWSQELGVAAGAGRMRGGGST
ncbi:uncharacterized protein J3R85_006869 [Psidium guajava]|nr:uncharacterized protein J3R85_006869 [Psidium guajava]